jgi:pyruvate formate lyase activating enzyme
LCAKVDAIKVDLKSYSEDYYRDVVNGELKPVLDALVTVVDAGVWTEIVYLVVPTLNDTDEEFTGLARWIVSNLGPDVPVHFTRFHPQYLLKNLPPTPVETLERAKAIADAEGIRYGYVGNVPGHPAEHTYCPACGRAVVERRGYRINAINMTNGVCNFCKGDVAGLWDSPL